MPPRPAPFDEWEALLEQGVGPFEASRKVGTTLRRLADSDPQRKQAGMELSRERRAAIIEQQIDERATESDQVLLAKARAEHPAYADKTTVEVGGPEGGPIRVEGRVLASLAGVVAFARSIGEGNLVGLDAGDPRRALSPAQDLLPDPAGDQRSAGVLPDA